jgi:hypothetical protein
MEYFIPEPGPWKCTAIKMEVCGSVIRESTRTIASKDRVVGVVRIYSLHVTINDKVRTANSH